MLDPWIIDEIRKHEDLEQRGEQPMLEIPLERPEMHDRQTQEEEKAERGVEIVDFGL